MTVVADGVGRVVVKNVAMVAIRMGKGLAEGGGVCGCGEWTVVVAVEIR